VWVASLITSGAAAFGRLFAVINVIMLPSLVLTVGLWLPIRADAFTTGGLTLTQLVPTNLRVDVSGLLLLIIVVVVGALSQTFQIGAVRLLEGYWGTSRAGLALASVGIGLS
jgi:hypothetical protein